MSTPGTHDGDDEIFETSDEELELQGDMSVPSAPALGFASLSDSELFEGDSIEEPRIDALKAFETFMGRTYDTAERIPEKSTAQMRLDAELGRQAASRGAEVAAMIAESNDAEDSPKLPTLPAVDKQRNAQGARETPLQRALRLQAELAELAGDLAEAEHARSSRSSERSSATPAHDTLGALSREVASMQASMEALRAAAAREGVSAATEAAAEHDRQDGASLDAGARRLSKTEPASVAAMARTTRGSDAVIPSGAGASALDAAALDARLAALEASVGQSRSEGVGGTAPRTAGLGLGRRVDELEAALGLLRPAALQAARGRARAATAELRGLQAACAEANRAMRSTAIESGVTGNRGSGDAGAETGAAVREAVGMLRRLDAQASAVPQLLGRLRALAVLHGEGARFSGRLSAAEDAVTGVESRLEADARAVTELREALVEAGTALEGSLSKAERGASAGVGPGM